MIFPLAELAIAVKSWDCMNKETKCAAQYFMLCLLWFSGAGATS
jgi:hypothetical protein